MTATSIKSAAGPGRVLWRLGLLVATLGVLSAGCSNADADLPDEADDQSIEASPEPDPTPRGALDSEGRATPTWEPTNDAQAWCLDAFNFTVEGVDEILAIAEAPDGTDNDPEAIGWLADKWAELASSAPDDGLAADAEVHADVLGALDDVFSGRGNTSLDTGAYRDASMALVIACRDYTPWVDNDSQATLR